MILLGKVYNLKKKSRQKVLTRLNTSRQKLLQAYLHYCLMISQQVEDDLEKH